MFEWLAVFLLSMGFSFGVVTIVGNIILFCMDDFKERH